MISVDIFWCGDVADNTLRTFRGPLDTWWMSCDLDQAKCADCFCVMEHSASLLQMKLENHYKVFPTPAIPYTEIATYLQEIPSFRNTVSNVD